ncbi:hypothetical protein ACWCQW_39985 [Streptomyces mirabilis]
MALKGFQFAMVRPSPPPGAPIAATTSVASSVADGMHHSAVGRATEPQTETQASRTTGSADAYCGVNACCTPAETSADPGVTVTEAKTTSGCGCQN